MFVSPDRTPFQIRPEAAPILRAVPEQDVRNASANARADRSSLGHLAPIVAEDARAGGSAPASLQNLLALVLGAGMGIFLLVASLMASIDGRLRFAESPVAGAAAPGTAGESGRGDALVSRRLAPVKDRRSFSAPFTRIVNGQEVIHTGRFTQHAARLATAGGDVDEPVPDGVLAAALRAPGLANPPDEASPPPDPGEEVEVLVSRHPLDPQTVLGDEGPLLDAARAAEDVRALRSGRAGRLAWLASGPAGFGTDPAAAFGDLGEPSEDPFAQLSVRFIPENVSTVQRLARRDEVAQRLAYDGSRPLPDLLASTGLPPAEADEAARLLAAAGIQPVRTLGIETAAIAPGSPVREILRISAEAGGAMVPLVARDDARRFVRVALPPDMPASGVTDGEAADNAGEPLWRGLYLSARGAGLDEAQATELIRLFAFDFDLEQGATPRDSVSLLQMEPAEEREPATGLGDVLAVDLTVAGQTRRYYRDPDGRSGDLSFVDAEGRSFRTELDKKPVASARLTSGFGGRYHPILHYTRPHNGIDWAARIGTPVLAAGDGEVVDAGVRSGFGRHIEIRHAEGFVTTYSHLDRIGRGIVAGKRVQRGDVIGTLGQSGLATGPHLHFEFKLNGIYVDPLTIRIPRPRLADTGPRFSAWVRQLDQLSRCESCDALH